MNLISQIINQRQKIDTIQSFTLPERLKPKGIGKEGKKVQSDLKRILVHCRQNGGLMARWISIWHPKDRGDIESA